MTVTDDVTPDGTGWARFSYDERFRYRLGRALTPRAVYQSAHTPEESELIRVTFVMLNPSTADAFRLDPTVNKCCAFARAWGAARLEVVNLFALRSTDPRGLDIPGPVGDDEANDQSILAACEGAKLVIAAWGNNGWRKGRDQLVLAMLRRAEIPLHNLGMTAELRPLHPLARGKAFIPLTREPVLWNSP